LAVNRVVAALMVVAFGGLAATAERSTATPVVRRETVKCSGVWRWPIKTLGDRPKLTTIKHEVQVSQLWGLAPDGPLNKTMPRAPGLETTIYTVTATLLYARHVDDEPNENGKGGGDQDYHLVIGDPKDPSKTMIVEFPDPHCTKGATAYRRAQMAHARAAFDAACHGAPRHKFANLSGTATITGVGFYDEPHANGRSLHGVELHPVLRFESSNCAWVP